MNEQTRQKELKWFVSFINADLDTLPISDTIKLTVEAVTIIFGMAPWLFGDKTEILMPSERWGDKIPIEGTLVDWRKNDKLRNCQNHIKKFFSVFTENVSAAREQVREESKSIAELKNFFLLEQVRLKKINIRVETSIIPWKNIMEKGSHLSAEISEEALLKSPINIAFKAETDEDTLLFHLIMALWLSPLGSIRTCEECDKYFVHTSKKKKFFCSSKCAMRKANRDRRKRIKENEPAKYKKELDKGKKRATKSYAQRMKKKVGKGVVVGKKL